MSITQRISAAAELTVDLGAIAANWQSLRARHPSGEVGAVLKADAYGLGAPRVASTLYSAGCRHFFVAHLQEALAIRALLPDAELAVLNGLWPGDAPIYAENGILPVLGSLREIAAWRGPALLHVDTGMHRLGLAAEEVAQLASKPGLLGAIDIRYVMTHLVSAELPGDTMNARQLARFAEACTHLPPARKSLANSSGIFLGPDFASDLARPGAALYGVNPTPGQPNPMRDAVRLRARILHVRQIGPGEAVGYNGTWTAARPSRIGTVSAGYADGFLRSLSDRAYGFFDGRPVPLVGRVSMDLATFDLTDEPGAQPGTWLDLIGPAMPVDAVATRAGTNGYEILTSLGRRYRRTYIGA